jgi:hypothetical protein
MLPIKAALFAGSLWIVFHTAVACSWDNPIWPKDRHSDTPLFRFVIDGKAGYIDASGKVIIPPQFRVFGNPGYDDFFEGVASTDTLRSNHIDSKGARINFAPYQVNGFVHFAEGLIPAAVVSGKTRKYGFVDHDGKLAIPATFDGVDSSSEGFAAVLLAGKRGYIYHSGTLVIPPRFNLTEKFSEGAARVIAGGPCNFVGYGPCAFFNPSILGFPEYKSGRDARYGSCQYSFVDERGVPLFSQRFPDAFDFAEGLAAVGDGKHWGFIDQTGEVRIPLRFDAVGSFSEGLAKFRQGRKWGFIDRAGRVVIQAQYENAYDFSSEAAVVEESYARVWFIDKSGNKLFGKDYKAASGFRLGLSHVTDGLTFAYIDRSGHAVFTYWSTTQN